MSESIEAKPWDIRVREVEAPLYPSHLRQAPTWVAFMREIDAEWQRYMREHDDPAERLATKVSERFRIEA